MAFFATLLINLAIGIALNVASTLAQQAFGQKGAEKADGPRGYRGTMQSGGAVPLSFLVGTIGVPGKLEYRNTWGNAGETPNAYLTDVISFGDLPIASFIGLNVNGEPVSIPASGPVAQGYPVPEKATESGTVDHLWREFFDGSQTTPNSFLTGTFGADPERPWLDDMIGRGVPYLTLTALVDDTVWPGFPTYMATLEGIKLYDVRKDSTKGGSGDHRWAGVEPTVEEQASWEFSDNNLVITYNIARGIYFEGEKVWGGNAFAYQLPYANWAAAMDACDETVDLAGGGSEPRFRAGREIFVNELPADVITELLVGANARICPSADGQFHVLVGVPDEADGSFTDADVIVSQATTFEVFPNLDQVVNGATATYLEPSQAWEVKETAPYYRSDLEAEDDGRRQLQGLTLGTTFSGTQAQRILKATVEESRRFRRHVVPLPPAFGVYRPLQVLSWTSVANGYSNKLFLITTKTEDRYGTVVLGLQEIEPADHGWTTADEQPLSFAPMTPIRPAAQPMTGWGAAAFTDTAGRRFGVEVTYRGGLADVRAVRVQVREGGGSKPVVFDSGETDYDITDADPVVRRISGSFLLPVTAYEVRGIYLPPDGSGRETQWSAWVSVTTPDIRLAFPDLPSVLEDAEDWFSDGGSGIPALQQEIEDRIADIAAERATSLAEIAVERDQRVDDAIAASDRIRKINEDLLNFALKASETILVGYRDKQELRTELRSGDDTVRAEYTLAITAATGPGSAVVARFEALEAETAGLAASIVSEALARATAIDAEATTRNALAVQLRGNSTSTALGDITTGLVASLNTAIVTETAARVEAITSLAVGAGSEFDYSDIWRFDSTVEGFTGNGTPTVSAGWLKPAAHASDPYVISPDVLGIDGAAYLQVKFRIRKTGTPAWEGHLWWQGPADSTWDAGRRVSFSEPTYTSGIGTAIVTATWTGTIDQIRIDLSSAADVSNYFEFDWIAVGRSSPPPSTAFVTEQVQAEATRITAEVAARELLSTKVIGAADATGATLAGLSAGLLFEERTARSAADASIVSDVTTIQATLTSTVSGLTGAVTSISAIDARVTTNEGGIAAHGSRLDTIEATIEDIATTEAIDELVAQVTQQEGSVTALGRSLRGLRSELLDFAQAAAEDGLQWLRIASDERAIRAEAYGEFRTNIALNADSIAVNAAAITTANALIATKADAAAVTILESRVTATETTNTSQGSAITSLENSVNSPSTGLATKATATALSALDTRVTATEATNTSQATSLTSLTAALSGYTGSGAVSTAISALDTRVTATESTNTSQASSITSLTSGLSSANTAIATKASSAALTALDTRVTSAEGSITSQASLISGIQTEVDDVSAGGAVRFKAVSSPGGGYSRYEIGLYASGPGSYVSGGLAFDVKSDGTRRAVMDFDDVLIEGKVDAAVLLQSGTTVTDLIAANATTVINSAYEGNKNITNGTPSSGSGAAVTLATMSLTPVNGTVLILASGMVGTDAWGEGSAYGVIRVQLLRAGTPMATVDVFYDEDGTNLPRNGAWNLAYRDTSPGTSAVTWTVRAYWLGTGGGYWAYSFNNSLVGINYKK